MKRIYLRKEINKYVQLDFNEIKLVEPTNIKGCLLDYDLLAACEFCD